MELWAGEEEEVCSVCGNLRRVIQFVDEQEQVYVYTVCGLCMATALEALTGHKYINQYQAWQALRQYKNPPLRIRMREVK